MFLEGDIISENINMTRMEISYYYDEFELTNNSILVCTETGYLPPAYVDLYFKESE